MKKERVQTPYIELSKVNRFFGITKDKSVLEVPWRSIRKIGTDRIIIEYDGVY